MSDFITHALWNWFLGWPWYAHALLALGFVLAVWGIGASLYSFVSKFGGWKAGVGALLAVAGIVAALWPRKGVKTDEIFPHPDVVAKPKRKHRPTIFDGLR